MKENPILFTTPMVKAILADRKTQTRRIVKPQPFDNGFQATKKAVYDAHHPAFVKDRCPYGQVGDLLWVRETWKYWNWTKDGVPCIKYKARISTDEIIFFESIPDDWTERLENIWAKLSHPDNYNIDRAARDRKWRPSIFMPKWATRIWLEIIKVRVERLKEISRKDAVSEGVCIPFDGYQEHLWPQENFEILWDSINGKKYPWSSNPWVWVVEFKTSSKQSGAKKGE